MHLSSRETTGCGEFEPDFGDREKGGVGPFCSSPRTKGPSARSRALGKTSSLGADGDRGPGTQIRESAGSGIYRARAIFATTAKGPVRAAAGRAGMVGSKHHRFVVFVGATERGLRAAGLSGMPAPSEKT